MSEPGVIRVAAVLLRDVSGRILTVRKRGTHRFMFSGGKPEAGETRLDTAVRECAEETRIDLDPEKLRLLGVFTAPAANEADFLCTETLFAYDEPIVTPVAPAAEIEQIRWIDPATDLPDDLAPLITEILPVLDQRHPIKRITFFTGSALGNDSIYAQEVTRCAEYIAMVGLGVVYGGGKVGLMGILADAALAAGGEVTGVIPQSLVDKELAHPNVTKLEIVSDMAQRKIRMGQLCDAAVALPGGSGTLEEFFEAWTWQQLGIHHKPVALYNVGGFWDPLIEAIKQMADKGFLSQDFINSLIVTDNPADLVEQIITWRKPAEKWSK